MSKMFCFKYFPAADGGAFEHSPELIRQVALFRPRPGQLTGATKLELNSTTSDPLGEIPVRQITAAGYGVFDITMLPGRVVRRIYNQWRFVPKSLFKNDAFALIDPGALPALTLRERRQQRNSCAPTDGRPRSWEAMMRVLLTGFSGYLGGVFSRHLSEMPEVDHVTGIDIVGPVHPLPPRTEFAVMDIRSDRPDPLAAQHDVVVHTAFVLTWLASIAAGGT
jgi:hypothetical protein